jgi:precorrin-3B methylase
MLYVVGTGPGNPDYMATRAKDVLKKVGSVAGYSTYIDLIKTLIKDKKIISATMTKEVQRVEMAINEALSRKPCALISGGDSGVYAMAGLVFEICKKRGWQLTKAKELILKHKNKNIPAGIVTGAMRENQKVTITRLENIDKEEVGVQSILFIGSTASVQYLDYIFTPRGYEQKYNF